MWESEQVGCQNEWNYLNYRVKEENDWKKKLEEKTKLRNYRRWKTKLEMEDCQRLHKTNDDDEEEQTY